MQRTVEKVFFALLRFEINGDELCEDVKNLITSETLPALFALAKKHDLAHLIGDALDKNGLLPDGTEAKKRFLQERNMAVYRYEQMQYEFEQICTTLENAKIPFIPLKGSVIRKYYPEPWMRTSCDMDVLVQEERLEDAIECLKNGLSYTWDGTKTVNDVSLFSEGGVHLELHYDLTEADAYAKDDLSRVWEYALGVEEKQYQKRLREEMFCFYHFVHMFKHFEGGGCGVRPFLDVYILGKGGTDCGSADALLKKNGLYTFANACKKLSGIWFNGEEKDEFYALMEEYVLTGGAFGTVKSKAVAQQKRRGGKWKYLWFRIFLPYDKLKLKYPNLEKRPWLYPFYQVKRWFKPLFDRKSREKSKRDLKAVEGVTKEEKEAVERLFDGLGI